MRTSGAVLRVSKLSTAPGLRFPGPRTALSCCGCPLSGEAVLTLCQLRPSCQLSCCVRKQLEHVAELDSVTSELAAATAGLKACNSTFQDSTTRSSSAQLLWLLSVQSEDLPCCKCICDTV